MEAEFRQLEGVLSTRVGYAGGTRRSPTYEDVCAGGTGHAEVVEVTYDSSRVSYERLLEVFWSAHDPRLRAGRGADDLSQYRSVIFFHTPEQERSARESKARLERSFAGRATVGTQILPAPTFWRAEEYHQQYYEKTGMMACPTRLRG